MFTVFKQLLVFILLGGNISSKKGKNAENPTLILLLLRYSLLELCCHCSHDNLTRYS